MAHIGAKIGIGPLAERAAHRSSGPGQAGQAYKERAERGRKGEARGTGKSVREGRGGQGCLMPARLSKEQGAAEEARRATGRAGERARSARERPREEEGNFQCCLGVSRKCNGCFLAWLGSLGGGIPHIAGKILESPRVGEQWSYCNEVPHDFGTVSGPKLHLEPNLYNGNCN